MKEITDLRIIGIDESRLPLISKRPYIDLFFKLSHQAPADWCNDFNALLAKHPTKPKIKEQEGLYIEAWVRTPDDIVACLDQLEATVAECSRLYMKRMSLSASTAVDANGQVMKKSAEQCRLNGIIAGLVFDKRKPQ